jgi:hypothetical protein
VAGAVYALRVYFVQGFYVVTYALGIYLLNLLIGFLSPPRPPPPPGRGTSQTAAAPAPAGSRNSSINRIHQATGGIHDNDTNFVRIRTSLSHSRLSAPLVECTRLSAVRFARTLTSAWPVIISTSIFRAAEQWVGSSDNTW